MRFLVVSFLFALLEAAPISLDLASVEPFGPVTVTREGATAVIRWPDETRHPWEAIFNLESTRPLIAAIRVNSKPVLENAVPILYVVNDTQFVHIEKVDTDAQRSIKIRLDNQGPSLLAR